jgi:hypothetical protein
MNKRIRELAEQAGLEPCIIFKNYAVSEKSITIEQKKFAELIILECTKAVMDGTKEGDHYAQRIEQHFDNGAGGVLHFGVEE